MREGPAALPCPCMAALLPHACAGAAAGAPGGSQTSAKRNKCAASHSTCCLTYPCHTPIQSPTHPAHGHTSASHTNTQPNPPVAAEGASWHDARLCHVARGRPPDGAESRRSFLPLSSHPCLRNTLYSWPFGPRLALAYSRARARGQLSWRGLLHSWLPRNTPLSTDLVHCYSNFFDLGARALRPHAALRRHHLAMSALPPGVEFPPATPCQRRRAAEPTRRPSSPA